MSDKTKGLYQKYIVEHTDGKALKGGCIVLEFGDKRASSAIQEFADNCRNDGYEQLADDLEVKLEEAAGGEVSMSKCGRYGGRVKL